MTTSNFCRQCGNSIEPSAQFCTKCGAKTESVSSSSPQQQSLAKSPKSAGVTLILCILFGLLGVHRFYVGKIGTGILMLITGGGFGIWFLVDLILIVNNKFEDSQGNTLELTKNPGGFKKAMMVIGVIIAWLIVYVSTLMILVFYATSGVVGTVHDQLKALQSGDIEKAYSYTSKDFQKVTSLEDFKNFLNQYPSLINNESSAFNERKVENNTGMVKGTLTAKDGAKTPVEYRLIREDGAWKILGISVMPTGAGIEQDHNKSESDNSASSQDSSLTNVYKDKRSKYSINYPANWEYNRPEKWTVDFSGKKGTSSYYSTVDIQTILTKKSGGKYANVKEVIAALKKRIADQSVDAKLLSQGEVELPQDPKRFYGEFLIYTFTYKGYAIKQMQFVIFRDDGSTFYTWAYSAPAQKYDADLPTAKAMYESWKID